MESQQTLLVIMAVFTGVAAVALLLQMVFLFGIYRSVRALKERSMLFLDRWEPVADSSLKALEQSGEILGKLSDLAELLRTARPELQRAERIDLRFRDQAVLDVSFDVSPPSERAAQVAVARGNAAPSKTRPTG